MSPKERVELDSDPAGTQNSAIRSSSVSLKSS